VDQALEVPGTVVSTLARMFVRLGIEHAFGVSGGAMAATWDALSASPIAVHHFRHEGGAAFAAIECGLAGGRPTIVFTTTGPGLTNALTGVLAARAEGARVLLVSAYTPAATRGRGSIQETSRDTLPPSFYESAGRLFDFAAVVEDPSQLPNIERALDAGFARWGGFVAHLALDTAAQRAMAEPAPPCAFPPAASPPDTGACIETLRDGPFALWLGFGARDAAAEVAAFARRMRAPVLCSPRAKGIFPEDDPLFVGVTGLAGHASVFRYLEEQAPRKILVLGSRLGEATSFWDPRFVVPGGFVHVDIDPAVPGAAYPDAPTLAVLGDVGAVLDALLEAPMPGPFSAIALPRPSIAPLAPRADGPVRPEALMDAVQRHVVDGSDALLLAESGNSFLWTTHRLRFAQPHRYRVSTGFGAMGHAAAGVVGAALGRKGRAVAVVGDGALLMTNEINSAVKDGVRAVWVVLNDARYGMCAQGMAALGLAADADFPRVDFAAFARAQGAGAVRVDSESQLDEALAAALACDGPFVVDVRIDRDSQAPASRRNAALADAEHTFPLRSGH
jgi:acetolactate synthase-1/2/3 large subunit